VPKTFYCQLNHVNCLKTASAIKVATMKILQTISVTNKSHTTKSILFAVRNNEWDAKEGTGKSTKNALHAQQYGKRYLLGS